MASPRPARLLRLGLLCTAIPSPQGLTSTMAFTFTLAHTRARHVRMLDSSPGGELVGARGRVGSALATLDSSLARITSRKEAALDLGRRSPPGTPIVVATGCESWASVARVAIARGRATDLVIVGNGPSEWVPAAATRVLLYAAATPDGRLETRREAPPCRVRGRHAEHIASVLRRAGVDCLTGDSQASFESHACAKLMWGCTMWLACAYLREPTDVLATEEAHVGRLQRELLPWLTSAAASHADQPRLEFIVRECARYSRALPGCMPSVPLAVAEFAGRNGYVLSRARATLGEHGWEAAMPLHARMLRAVVPPDALSVVTH